jgi:hypothetical protein
MFQYQNTNLDTFLQVFDPSGYLVKWNDDAPGISRNSYLTYQFSQTGNYRIQATRFGSSYGAYRLRLEVGRGAAAGDVDMNCIVDTDDYNIIYQSFNGVLSDPRADVNLNGYFDSSDLDIWRSNNGTTCASGASTLQPQNKK